MPTPLRLHPNRLLPLAPEARNIARRLYESVATLPIISPHGHTDPRWFATDAQLKDPTALLSYDFAKAA
jgi:glucuronate isomerase